jgi:cytochrome c oxidase subunit 2
MIVTVVACIIITLALNKYTNRYILEGQIIEVSWTLAPAIILVFIAVPSLWLLYLIDEIHNPTLTIKAIRHQWYRRYEYSDFIKVEFDSYVTPQDVQEKNIFRLLNTDNHTTVPIN